VGRVLIDSAMKVELSTFSFEPGTHVGSPAKRPQHSDVIHSRGEMHVGVCGD
jgi:hypothetical protein